MAVSGGDGCGFVLVFSSTMDCSCHGIITLVWLSVGFLVDFLILFS